MKDNISKIKITVLINCYNYRNYVVEAIESVAAQTIQPHELIIVDDGSVDGSVEVIKKAIEEIEWAQLIEQKNQGQLAALKTGIENATGDILFLLDADDLYKEDHIEINREYFIKHLDCDILSVRPQLFGKEVSNSKNFWECKEGRVGYRALNLVAGLGVTKASVRGLTSGLIFRSEFVKTHFVTSPIIIKDWKICADDYILWNLVLAGACQYVNNQETFLYRIHGSNNYSNTSISVNKKKIKDAMRMGATARAKGFLLSEIPLSYDCLSKIYREYKGNNVLSIAELISYSRVVLHSRLSIWKKIRNISIMITYTLKDCKTYGKGC